MQKMINTDWRDFMFKLPHLTKKERAWVLYDIANSAFVLTVITVFFPILFEMVYADGNGIGEAYNIPKILTDINGVESNNKA